MRPSLQFAVSCLCLTASLLAHSGLTAYVISNGRTGWVRILAAFGLLINGLIVLASLIGGLS